MAPAKTVQKGEGPAWGQLEDGAATEDPRDGLAVFCATATAAGGDSIEIPIRRLQQSGFRIKTIGRHIGTAIEGKAVKHAEHATRGDLHHGATTGSQALNII